MPIAIQPTSGGTSVDAYSRQDAALPSQRGAQEESMMRKWIVVIALCLLALPALCQSTSKYQLAIITEVKPRDTAGSSTSDPARYDVSVKVGDRIYVVLYTQLLGELPPKYATGHELLVLAGKDTITYNDMLGRSLQVQIESLRPATESKASK
jgi:hypothetical protein